MTKEKYLHKIGETSLNSKGLLMTITEYHAHKNIEVKFEDGTKVCNINYSRFKEGGVAKPVNRVGEIHITNQGYKVEIIEYFGWDNCTIRFEDGSIVKNRQYTAIVDGRINNVAHLSKYNVGYNSGGKYKAEIRNVSTKEYTVWDGMLRRCYNEKERNKFPSYKDVTVCEEWKDFQNFAEWYENNHIEGFELDKDILFKGNKIYSPSTCCFVPREINILFSNSLKTTRTYPLGVHYETRSGKFVAQIHIHKKSKFLGRFNTPEEAFEVYKIAKEKRIKEVAEKHKHQITEACYQALINYQVEITD